jgi:hypothetical protein
MVPGAEAGVTKAQPMRSRAFGAAVGSLAVKTGGCVRAEVKRVFSPVGPAMVTWGRYGGRRLKKVSSPWVSRT